MSMPAPLKERIRGAVLVGYRGSVAHGTYVPNNDPKSIDDKDVMGLVVAPPEVYYGLSDYGSRGTIEIGKGVDEWDVVLYDIRKAVRLLLNGNPNVLSLLWLPETLYIYRSPLGQKLIDNKSVFVGKHVYKSFVGYASSQALKMESGVYRGFMGEKRKALVEQFGFDCHVDTETEFLTERGWCRFDEVADARLATVTKSGALEFQYPLSVTDRRHSGDVYLLEPHSSRTVITPNHALLVSPARRSKANGFSVDYAEGHAQWGLHRAVHLLEDRRSHFHIRRAPRERQHDLETVTDEYLALAGLYLSEGTTNFRDGTVKAVRFTQSKPGPFWEAASRLQQLFPIRRYDYARETVWIVSNPIAYKVYADFGHSKEKRLPEWCLHLSARQAEILWRHSMYGDGSAKTAHDVLYTSSKKLADSYQAMLVSAGLPSTVYGPYRTDSTFGESWMYHVVRSNKTAAIHTLRINHRANEGPFKMAEAVKERVVCFEVPNGTLITRSQGKPAIHGNCKNASHLIRILRQGVEFLTTGELNVQRFDAPELLAIKRGDWPLERVKEESARLFALAQEAYIRSDLPPGPDHERAEALCVEIVRETLKERGH